MNDEQPIAPPSQADFSDALAKEFDLTPEDVTPPVATPPVTPPAEPPVATPPVETPPVTPPVTPPATPPATPPEAPVEKTAEEKAAEEAELSKNETQEETAARHAEAEAERIKAEAPKYATPDDVKNAMREYHQETQGRVEKLHTAQNEIISTLYPEGIDKNIYDTDGKVIKTAQDIVDRGLINDRTQEPYTYEEAASFVLEANRKMSENLEELNNWAEQVAEQNISLIEGNERVMGQWGDILQAMPELAKELAAEYITTQLTFDKTGNYITKMSMSPEAYYNRVMSPYRRLGEALATKQAEEAAATAAATAKANESIQNERNGIPPQRGSSDVKANTGDPMLDALVDELNKG